MNLNGNDLIKEFQMQKIASEKFHDISTLIVGDSSAGNALDAKYFSELSEQKSSNLSLTGSWGIVGSLGMIQNSLKKNPHIQNIIIIQTPDIWGRSFAKESILELYTFKEMYKYLSLSTIISYFFNPAEIWWHLKYKIFSLKHQSTIDPDNDYVLQKNKKYSNGLLTLNSQESLNAIEISNDKKKELKMVREFCQDKALNCIFLKGPIHATLKKNSQKYLHEVDELLSNQKDLTYIPTTFSYPDKCMGDSLDHVDPRCKKNVTLDYYRAISPYLQR